MLSEGDHGAVGRAFLRNLTESIHPMRGRRWLSAGEIVGHGGSLAFFLKEVRTVQLQDHDGTPLYPALGKSSRYRPRNRVHWRDALARRLGHSI